MKDREGFAGMDIGKRVRRLRKAKGMSQSELARRAGLSNTYLSDLENGRRDAPTAPVLSRLAVALEVSADTLLGIDTPLLNRGTLPADLPDEALAEWEDYGNYLRQKYQRKLSDRGGGGPAK